MKPTGYLVIDKGGDHEQPLGLRKGPHLPFAGLLAWTDGPRALFATREEAVLAIARTEHWRLAFTMADAPEKRCCQIIPVTAALPCSTPF